MHDQDRDTRAELRRPAQPHSSQGAGSKARSQLPAPVKLAAHPAATTPNGTHLGKAKETNSGSPRIFTQQAWTSPDSEQSQQFFVTVQNKMHWATHGHTGATAIDGSASHLERPLQTLTETNLDPLLGIRFVAS